MLVIFFSFAKSKFLKTRFFLSVLTDWRRVGVAQAPPISLIKLCKHNKELLFKELHKIVTYIQKNQPKHIQLSY